MKSSTIRRSNLSKEKIAVLEALSKFNGSNDNAASSNVTNNSGINNAPVEDGSPEVYVRQNKEKELDILWKDFKLPKGERSPIVYLGIGFVTGVITTLLVSAFIGMSSGDFHPSLGAKKSAEVAATTSVSVPEETSVTDNSTVATETEASSSETSAPEEKSSKKFGLFGSKNANSDAASETVAAQQPSKEYEVQSGDTMEKIVRSFYGSYSEEKVNAVMKANNMTDANKLSIGQKLIIPSEGISSAE